MEYVSLLYIDGNFSSLMACSYHELHFKVQMFPLIYSYIQVKPYLQSENSACVFYCVW